MFFYEFHLSDFLIYTLMLKNENKSRTQYAIANLSLNRLFNDYETSYTSYINQSPIGTECSCSSCEIHTI